VQHPAAGHQADRRPAQRARVSHERQDEHRQVEHRAGHGAQPDERRATDRRLGQQVPAGVRERGRDDERKDIE
jgi:hypothetical protein